MSVKLTATSLLAIGGSPLEVLDIGARESARGASIVLLHQGLGSIALWRSLPERLHELTGRRVIAFSRHGHGFSGAPPEPRTPAFFHEEALQILPALLAELGEDSPVLVGHSDGGSIALIHAAHHPVEALVLMAPHVFVEQLTLDAITETREAYLSGDLRARMQRHHADVDAAFWGWCDVWLDPAFRFWNLELEASRVSAPMLLIQGTEDPYGTIEQIDRIAAGAQGTVERLLVSGGHSPHLEHPETVAAAVAAFVALHSVGGLRGSAS